MNRLTSSTNDLIELFFPSLCITCGKRLVTQEKYMCMDCWTDMPLCNFFSESENKVAQLLWGRVKLELGTSYFSYKKGSKYQQLVYYIKYQGLKELGFELGRRFGYSLLNTPFDEIDIVVPVPLHPKKRKKRGFNQSEYIARGMAEVLKKELVCDNLKRKVFTSTQTKKNRFERWQNVEGIFELNDALQFSGKHILLIDDVVTTGSTLEACAYQILKSENTKVSIATLAFADF